MKRRPIALLLALSMLLTGCDIFNTDSTPEPYDPPSQGGNDTDGNNGDDSYEKPEIIVIPSDGTSMGESAIEYMKRPSLLEDHYFPAEINLTPTVSYQTPNSDLSNVYFGNFGFYDERQTALLAKNGFLLSEGWNYEFFEVYETNRYMNEANYVTIDSMMHTYHLYFAHLLKKVEQTHLIG